MPSRPILTEQNPHPNVHYECPKCHMKHPALITVVAIGSVGQLVKMTKIPNPCPRCGSGTIRRVKKN